MSDDCTVDFLPGAMKDLDRIARRDPVRLPILEQKVAQVEEDGWILSTRSELIKVLRSETCVGEIRDLGRGGYRLFFFWTDGEDRRDLHVTHIRSKSQVTGRARLSETLDAVERLRDWYLNEE